MITTHNTPTRAFLSQPYRHSARAATRLAESLDKFAETMVDSDKDEEDAV